MKSTTSVTCHKIEYSKATNAPVPCLNRPQVKAKTQGQFIRAIRNYAQNASLTNRYITKKSAWVPFEVLNQTFYYFVVPNIEFDSIP